MLSNRVLSSQESISTTIELGNRTTLLPPMSSNECEITINKAANLDNYKLISSGSNIMTLSPETTSSLQSVNNNTGNTSTGIHIIQNEIVPTTLRNSHQHAIHNEIEDNFHQVASSLSLETSPSIVPTYSPSFLNTGSLNITTSQRDDLKGIHMNPMTSRRVNIIDECCPSPTLTHDHHDTILMQITTVEDDNLITIPQITALSLNSSNGTKRGQIPGSNNNNKSRENNNNNILTTTNATMLAVKTIVNDNIECIISNNERHHNITNLTYQEHQNTESQQHQSNGITTSNIIDNENKLNKSILTAHDIGNSDNFKNNNIICSSSTSHGVRIGVVSTTPRLTTSFSESSSTPMSSSSVFENASTSTAALSDETGDKLLGITNTSNASTTTNAFEINLDSPSSNSLQIDDSDHQLEDNEGYQDNASSNSQQSSGGGNMSSSIGGGGVGSIAGGNGTSASMTGNGNSNYISLLPPPIGTSGTPGQSGEGMDFKYLFEELCPVCGDKVSGYHYGLLTCESCKGFFKRTVQNKKVYTCVAERSCHIDKTQRKRCPYCRFQKCLDVGMKLEAVRADRMRGGRNKFGPMYKRDRARKLQMMRQRQLALQAIRGSMGGSSNELKSGQLSPTGYQQTYPNMNIKQEIQIPQVSSLTQSPDSSPSPIAIALGQVNSSTAVNANTLSGSVGTGPGSTNTTTTSGGNTSHGHGSDTGSGTSLQHASESKLWYTNPLRFSSSKFNKNYYSFDTGTNPTSTADSVSAEPLRVSPMIREFVQSIDDREWQTQLFTLLQKQTYNQVEVDLFELMCKVLDQNLFSQVDWARNTVFFKDLKVDDQMKLLQHSWSDMLVLDHLHQRIHNNLPDETPLNNGQVFNLLALGLLGVPQLADYFNELQNKLQELKFDMGDYVCMKFLILLNPNVRGIINRKTVLEGHENVQAALLDYTLTCYPTVTDKFSRLLSIIPEIHAMAARGEEHLYLKHVAGNAPTQTLLMEMLHAKRKV